MHLLVRLRRLLSRRPWLYWLAAGAAAALAAASVHDALAAAEARRAEWGATVTVWVATAPADLGEPLAVEARDYPVAMVPASALSAAPAGPAARAVAAGEILTLADIAIADLAGGSVVVAVPAAGTPRLAEGSEVVLLANGVALCDGRVAATPGAEWLEVAVAEACAADLAAHLAAGTVLVARRA